MRLPLGHGCIPPPHPPCMGTLGVARRCHRCLVASPQLPLPLPPLSLPPPLDPCLIPTPRRRRPGLPVGPGLAATPGPLWLQGAHPSGPGAPVLPHPARVTAPAALHGPARPRRAPRAQRAGPPLGPQPRRLHRHLRPGAARAEVGGPSCSHCAHMPGSLHARGLACRPLAPWRQEQLRRASLSVPAPGSRWLSRNLSPPKRCCCSLSQPRPLLCSSLTGLRQLSLEGCRSVVLLDAGLAVVAPALSRLTSLNLQVWGEGRWRGRWQATGWGAGTVAPLGLMRRGTGCLSRLQRKVLLGKWGSGVHLRTGRARCSPAPPPPAGLLHPDGRGFVQDGLPGQPGQPEP